MMLLFGGWEAYRNAPAHVVEEQTLLWIAHEKAEAERAKEEEYRARRT